MDRAALKIKYDNFKKMNLDLDLTRGKPSVEQLNLSNPLMSNLKNQKDFKVEIFFILSSACKAAALLVVID